MSDKDTSTLQSYVDKASGLAQSALGAVTGSNADKQAGQNKQDEAALKNDISHSGATIGGISVGPDGVAKNDPERQAGSWDQTIGSAKEAVGGLVGSEGMKKEGQDQRAQGQAREAAGQLSDLGQGISDRVQGTVGGAVAGLTGDRDKEKEFQSQHDTGKTLQRGAEVDINKQNS